MLHRDLVFDGVAIAEASNDGHGGMTFIHVQLAEAQQFTKSLPPDTLEGGISDEDDEPLVIEISLDYLVDQLAEAIHAGRKLRTAYSRDTNSKVLLIRDGELLFLKGVKLKAITDRTAYFAALRARRQQPMILAELPPDEAFALWKQHVLGSESS